MQRLLLRNSNVLSVFHIISNFQFQIRCQWSALFPAFSYLNIGIAVSVYGDGSESMTPSWIYNHEQQTMKGKTEE